MHVGAPTREWTFGRICGKMGVVPGCSTYPGETGDGEQRKRKFYRVTNQRGATSMALSSLYVVEEHVNLWAEFDNAMYLGGL